MKHLTDKFMRIPGLVFACILSGWLFSGCGLVDDLLDDPEYPDASFSVVGTWEYHIKPCTWGMPDENRIYDAKGYLTFTDDGKFSYTIHSDNGLVKGYGTWYYNGAEDGVDASSGISMSYSGWEDAREVLEEYGASGFSGSGSYISWGNGGDRIEHDYMLVGKNDVTEYRRVESIPYNEEITAYRSLNSDPLGDWALVKHTGIPVISIPNEGVGVLDSWNKYHLNKE